MEEIDRVIRELEGVREMLRIEGERVSGEIASFATLNYSATTAMKVIADSLKQGKRRRCGRSIRRRLLIGGKIAQQCLPII